MVDLMTFHNQEITDSAEHGTANWHVSQHIMVMVGTEHRISIHFEFH